jgi:undecaprenyl-diphosphatase
VHSLLPIVAALVYDLAHRARFPVTAVGVGVACGLASLTSTVLKAVFDRPRPEGPYLVDVPTSASFPSGHATTAFGAAAALAVLAPSLRWWALAGAAIVAYSRVHLGVHYVSDVVGGAVIGASVGVAVAVGVRQAALRRRP